MKTDICPVLVLAIVYTVYKPLYKVRVKYPGRVICILQERVATRVYSKRSDFCGHMTDETGVKIDVDSYYEQYYEYALRMAYTKGIMDANAAEEVASEALKNVWTQKKYDPNQGRTLKNYLAWQIGKRADDWHRKNEAEAKRTSPLPSKILYDDPEPDHVVIKTSNYEDNTNNPVQSIIRKEDRQALYDLLKVALTPEEIRLLNARYWEEKTHSQIAEELTETEKPLTEDAVRKRISRVIKRLKAVGISTS